MIVSCSSFTARVLPSGKIELKLDDPKVDPIEEHIYLPEIAKLLRKSVKQVHKLSTRKRNPLPVRRGNGRPYGFRSEINAWLTGNRSDWARFQAVFG
jgi:predicted DNA-binding transcriptional regulator AlpA